MLSEKLKALAEELKEKNSLEYLARPENKVYGILYGDGKSLKYGAYENERIDSSRNYLLFTPKNNSFSLCAVFADEDEVYFDEDNGNAIGRFFSENEISINRPSPIQSIIKHKNRILDSGAELFDANTNEKLISIAELAAENIADISSLAVGKTDDLYFLAKYGPRKNNEYGIMKVIENDGKYKTGNEIFEILHYNVAHDDYAQVQIIPFKNRNMDFSIMSCVNLEYLDLNKEEIKGTRITGSERYIHRLEILNCSGKEAEVIYSGSKLNEIMYARINLEKKEVAGNRKHALFSGLSSSVYALGIVRNEDLHKRLIEKGTLIKC